ncbi:MAG TPA: DVUA0089 family protein [Bryobacteraceae bacterium]|nr:DVUA0089 family protein [Bryobacteraceae bacterium]
MAVIVFMILLLCQSAAAAIWLEEGDAGRIPANAQAAGGQGQLTYIGGNLSEWNDVDLYRIMIVDPLGFSAETIGFPGGVPDPKLYLFTNDGKGVYMNDDTGDAQALLPGAHPLGPRAAGLYLLGITRFGFYAASASGEIFPEDPFDVQEIHGPTGPGGANALSRWTGLEDDPGLDLDTFYVIGLTGANAIPEPSTWSLAVVGLAASAALRFRRRS